MTDSKLTAPQKPGEEKKDNGSFAGVENTFALAGNPNGQPQGGMCALPMPQFPTGVMRGRFHPRDGQLYGCGMFAWAGNQSQPGGFYRVSLADKALPQDELAKTVGRMTRERIVEFAAIVP